MQVCLPAPSSTVHSSPPAKMKRVEKNENEYEHLFSQAFVTPLCFVWRNPVHVKQLAKNKEIESRLKFRI